MLVPHRTVRELQLIVVGYAANRPLKFGKFEWIAISVGRTERFLRTLANHLNLCRYSIFKYVADYLIHTCRLTWQNNIQSVNNLSFYYNNHYIITNIDWKLNYDWLGYVYGPIRPRSEHCQTKCLQLLDSPAELCCVFIVSRSVFVSRRTT